MNPGDLVRPRWNTVYVYDIIQPYLGFFISTLEEDRLGFTIDFGYSASDVPYIRILNSDGILGWVRYELVEVLR